MSFTGRSGRTCEFDVLSRQGPFRAQGGVYVLAHVHPRGHLAGFAAEPVLWGHAEDMRAEAEGIRARGDACAGYYSHVCVLYLAGTRAERQELVDDLQEGSPPAPRP